MIDAFGNKVLICSGIAQIAGHNARATYAELSANVVVFDVISSVVDDPRDNISKNSV